MTRRKILSKLRESATAILDRGIAPLDVRGHGADGGEYAIEVDATAIRAVADALRPADGPEIVCLSGSTRFIERMATKAWELEKAGKIVLSCHLLPASYGAAAHHQAEAEGVADHMDELHRRKIDLADRVLVINVAGYIGDSTRVDIEYAQATGVPVDFLEWPGGLDRVEAADADAERELTQELSKDTPA